jgi:hypothetical protein
VAGFIPALNAPSKKRTADPSLFGKASIVVAGFIPALNAPSKMRTADPYLFGKASIVVAGFIPAFNVLDPSIPYPANLDLENDDTQCSQFS